MDRHAYTSEDAWLGSYYELCLELGPAGDDTRLRDALDGLWSNPRLCGPWLERDHFGRDRAAIDVRDLLRPLYGAIRIDEHITVGCVSHVVREDEGSDWVDLCIPTGMLELAFPVTYPIDRESNRWTFQLDRFLASVGADVFRLRRFELAVIGEEASGIVSSKTLSADDLRRRVLLLPIGRWHDHATSEPIMLTDGLVGVGLGGAG
jgi:hypothetical protein